MNRDTRGCENRVGLGLRAPGGEETCKTEMKGEKEPVLGAGYMNGQNSPLE